MLPSENPEGYRCSQVSAAVTLLMVTLCVLVAGCGGSDFPKRYGVEGCVRIDGADMEKGLISFIPLAPTKGPKVVGLVRDGKYVIDEAAGPSAGRFLVKIETVPPEIEAIASGKGLASQSNNKQRPRVAAKFNRNSQLEVVVGEEARDCFDFDVESMEATRMPANQP